MGKTPLTQSSIVTLVVALSAVWHRRLGHLVLESLSKLVSTSAISCTKGMDDSLFHACQLGCHISLPFPTSSSRALKNLNLIHCDLWTSPVVCLVISIIWSFLMIALAIYGYFRFALSLKSSPLYLAFFFLM